MKPRPVLYSLILFLLAWNMLVPDNSARNQQAAVAALPENAPVNPFSTLQVQAQAYLVFDLTGGRGEISSQNADMRRPLASLTKLMTAVVADENIPSDAAITVSRSAVLQSGDDGLLVGERFGRDDLRDIMMIQSSNDAAYALADYLGADEFVRLMNSKAAELKLTQTAFANANGLDNSEYEASAYSSAYDLSALIKYILENHPDILEVTRLHSKNFVALNGHRHQFTNTDRIVDDIPQLIGGKTGFTDLAGGNLAIVVDVGINHPVVMVVLGSSEVGRFSDMLALYEATVKWFQQR